MAKSKKRKKKLSKKAKKQAELANLSPKEIAALKRQAAKDKKKLINVISVVIGCLLFLTIPLSLIDPKIGLALGAGIPVMYFSYQYPRTGLWLFLIYMPFSGTVIYQFVGGNAIFNLAKDGFFIPACIALGLECKKKKQPLIINKKILFTLIFIVVAALLTLLVVNGMMQFILPLCSSLPRRGRGVLCKDGVPLAQGILGLKVLLGYVPLIFCTYYMVNNKKDLLRLGRVHLVLALICTILGVYQYYLLDSGACVGTRNEVGDALFKASVDAKCFVGGSVGFTPTQNFIRLPGTFSSPWHWAWFLIANSAITFTVAFGDTSLWWRMGGLVGMVLVFVNAVISGQRIALALVPVVTVILFVLTGQVTNLKRFIPILLGLVLILGIVITTNPDLIQERIDSLAGRAEASPPTAFIEEQFHWALKEQRGPLGRGLGKATNSTRIFGRSALVETFHPKLIYEMGLLGCLAFFSFTTNIVWETFRIRRSLKTPTIRNYASSLWVFILIISFNTYWYPLDTDPVAVYYWLFVGLLFKLPEIDKQEQERLKAAKIEEAKLGLDRKKSKGKIAEEAA
ncbi:MAG: hormogonium polysaccharide biosynthesis protein HpsL [Cyanobacteria bacterium SBLK]|nr:hormogonium polysaccharide biosynthesis protein HpsL [Cyanobacteria bacterium SBLK]